MENIEGTIIRGERVPTKDDIRAMKGKSFQYAHPFVKQSCADCNHCKSALSWWCTNKEAIAYRGTTFPGVIFCHFWSPRWSDIPKKYRIAEYGYVSKVSKLKLFQILSRLIRG